MEAARRSRRRWSAEVGDLGGDGALRSAISGEMERRGLTEPLRVQDEMRTTSTYGINRRLFCRVAGACALCKACMPYEPNVPVEIRYRSTPRRPALANTAEYTRTLRGDPDADRAAGGEDV